MRSTTVLAADHGARAFRYESAKIASNALRDRVGEDVAAAYHRDAEDDRERGERGAELASQRGP